MEDLKNKKQNINPADLPVKRKEDGSIDLEALTISIDEKGNRIIPDDYFDCYFRELPDKVINSSKTWRTARGGKIKIFGGDPEADKEIQKAGGESLQAALKQRRTSREILEELARKKANIDDIERLGLESGASNLEAANYAQIRKAMQGDTKAMEYIRDTMGEKPTEKLDASITALTPEDKELLKNVEGRLAAADPGNK